MKTKIIRAGFVLLCSLLISTYAHAKERHTNIGDNLAGFWDGTFAVEDLSLKGADKHLSMELAENGRFVIYGFNFHTLERTIELKGAWKLDQDWMVFTWEEKGDMVSVPFEYKYVEREERNPDHKWRLYLNNHERGIHLHLGWKGPVASRH